MRIRSLQIILFTMLLTTVSPRSYAADFIIPDWVQKSCVFIMDGAKAQGTGFLIWLKDEDRTFCYLVTARHVVQPILNKPNASLSVRFNLKEKGKSEIITFPTFTFNGLRWAQHNNSAVDLAVMPLTIFNRIQDLEVAGHLVADSSDEYFASAAWIKKYNVGVGDNIFALGLVPYLFSNDQINLVLARFGRVSLLSQDEISFREGKQKAYFVDSPSFGGNSGGPVFIRLERDESGIANSWRFALLGTIIEFVPSPLRMAEVNVQNNTAPKNLLPIENTGITRVVPVDYLTDILFSDEQKAFRKEILKTEKMNQKQ